MTSLPAIFVSHGAPDLPIRDGAVTHFLKLLMQRFQKPKAILVISAHWHTADPTVRKCRVGNAHHLYFSQFLDLCPDTLC